MALLGSRPMPLLVYFWPSFAQGHNPQQVAAAAQACGPFSPFSHEGLAPKRPFQQVAAAAQLHFSSTLQQA